MDYGDSSVEIYNNSIEFFNPETLPDTISIEQLLLGNYVSQTRNKKLASIFKEAGLIEKYGSGIKRIQEQFFGYGLQPPVFENIQHGFTVVVTANEHSVVENVVEKVVEKVGEKVGVTVTPNQKKILESIKENAFISANKLSKQMGISHRKVQENIQKLKGMNKLKRIGPDKGGYWEIV